MSLQILWEKILLFSHRLGYVICMKTSRAYERVKVSLENQDFFSLSERAFSWSSLENIEKIFSVIGLTTSGRYWEAEKLVFEHKDEFNEIGFFNLLMIRIRIDLDKEYADYFLPAILEDLPSQSCQLLKAEFFFQLGYMFLSVHNFELADANYQKAQKIYKEKSLFSRLWMSKLGSNVCALYLDKYDEHQKGLAELSKDIQSLNEAARPYLGGFLVWQNFYVGKIDEARELSLVCLRLTEKHGLDDRSKHIKYLYYIERIWPSGLELPDLDLLDSVEFNFIEHSHEMPIKDIVEKIKWWNERCSYVDKYQYTDLVFDHLLKKRNFEALLDVFKEFETEVLPSWRQIIPPRNFYFTACLASKAINRSRMHETYLVKHKNSSQKWEQEDLRKKLFALEERLKKNIFILDHAKKELRLEENSWSLKKRPKTFSLFDEISKITESIDIYDLDERIYGSSNESKDQRSRITVLARRSMNLFESVECLRLEGDRLILVKPYRWKSINRVAPKKRNRKVAILDLLKESESPKTAQEIALLLGVTKRTITNDLKELAHRGHLKAHGVNRSTRYSS